MGYNKQDNQLRGNPIVKKVPLLFFLAIAFFSFAGFYISAKFRPLPTRELSTPSDFPQKHRPNKTDRAQSPKNGMKKARIAGCVVKGEKCTCYTRQSRALDMPMETCKRAIQSGQMPSVILHESDDSSPHRL